MPAVRAGKAGHVLHHPKDFAPGLATEIDLFAHVEERNLLRSFVSNE